MPINNFLLPGAKFIPGYEVANSCRFAGDAHGQKSISSGGSGTTATFSAWVKTSPLPDKALFTSYIDANNFVEIYFNSGQFRVYHYDGGSKSNDIQTNPYYRDPTAWYHFHVIFDTANGTEADRVQMSVNGTRVTSFKTSDYPTSSQDLELNSSSATFNLAARNADEQWKGYMAEVVWLDGTASAVTNFGEFDEDSPTIWKPKNVSGLSSSKGTNGFYCDFEDSSNLGNDVWGGTDFTETNLAATDQATDTPTNNFATINPLDNYFYAATLSEGNLKQTCNSSNYSFGTNTFGVSQGKWVVEVKIESGSTVRNIIGITDKVSTGTTDELSSLANAWSYISAGNIYNNGSDIGGSYDSFTTNDIIGIYLDLDNNKLYFSKNGTVQNSGTGISITAPSSTTNGVYFFAFGDYGSSDDSVNNVNFGSPAFAISSGNTDGEYGNFEYTTTITGDSASKTFKALNTKNLSEFG